jgi:hypothetical protein
MDEVSIKKFSTENWFKVAIILLVLFSFYWFEYRTEEARKTCDDSAQAGVNTIYGTYISEKGPNLELQLNQIFYQNCMRGGFGLKP